MSELAWKILSLWFMGHGWNTQIRDRYIPDYRLGEYLGGNGDTVHAMRVKYTPENAYERAIKELIDVGLIEEVPEHTEQWRLVVKGEKQV